MVTTGLTGSRSCGNSYTRHGVCPAPAAGQGKAGVAPRETPVLVAPGFSRFSSNQNRLERESELGARLHRGGFPRFMFYLRSRQRLKCFAFCLGVRAFVSPPICEALASDPLQGFVGAFKVSQLAGVVTEIELSGVALQMRFADMVINADDPALEDGEEVFNRIGVEIGRTAIFAG